MKDLMICIGIIIGVILIFAICLALSGLIWWGVGAFVVWAFKIGFIWTFWHGIAIALLTFMLGGIFKVTIKKED